MKIYISILCIVLLAGPARISRAQAPGHSDGLSGMAVLLEESNPPQDSSPALTLDDVEQIAIARNPEIEVAVRRVAIAEAHVPAAGALDDPIGDVSRMGSSAAAAVELQRRAEHVQHQPDACRGRASGRCARAWRSRMWTWPKAQLDAGAAGCSRARAQGLRRPVACR